MQFRADIQGLRAIAVLAVMVFHLNPGWLPGGFVGVDIFLVISGFLISSILLHKKSKEDYSLSSTLNYFYTSRLKRIVPAYYSTLVIVSLIAAVLFLPTDFSIYRSGLKQAAWFNSNNYFANFGDYFAPANHEQPLLHTWSLAIEIQFYLIAPFIFLLIPKKQLYWLLPTAIFGLTAYAEYRLQSGLVQSTYYSLIARLPAFFLGGWIALGIVNSNRYRGGDRGKLWLSCLALGLIILAFIMPKPTGHFPGIAGLIPVAAAGLIIWLNADNKITAFLSIRPMVWIGALSYSLYLWHWPVLAFMRYYTGAEILGWQFSLAFVGLTLILASASYYWVETPLRLKRNKVQITGYVCLAILVLISPFGMKKINNYFTESVPIEYMRYGDDSQNCHGHMVGDCLRGDLSSDKEVLVLGDSHAAMLNHFFDYLGKELGFKARVITASSCVTIPGFDYRRIPEYAHKECLSQIKEAKAFIENATVIFLAGVWNTHLKSVEFREALSEFLTQNKAEVNVISQEPRLKRNPLRKQRFNMFPFKGETELNVEYVVANDYLKSLSNNRARVNYLELDNLQLFDDVPYWNGELIYYDEHHINEVGAKEYAKQALPIIRQVLSHD